MIKKKKQRKDRYIDKTLDQDITAYFMYLKLYPNKYNRKREKKND